MLVYGLGGARSAERTSSGEQTLGGAEAGGGGGSIFAISYLLEELKFLVPRQ